ncbi:polynucleotide 5'-hydroxyl-kinase NOL9 [Planococcus citri]|uniref:polynucleotide 5'-hydroxyl-kinase NOL9 n=1 Tax=Planococcus citri TaxID=170843 RepID=UPI0031F8C0A3
MEVFAVGELVSPNFKVVPVTENASLISTDLQTEIGTSGIFTIKVITGIFEILGWKLTAASDAVKIHSTKEFSLKISPVSNKSKNKTTLNRAYLKSFNFNDAIIDNVSQFFESATYLLLITTDESSTLFGKYLESYIESPLYSKRILEKSVISFDSSHAFPKYNSIRTHQEWLHFGSTLIKAGKKVIITGGKNAGKSTLLKYLINKSLASNSKVLVLDFDPGQAEFTVMGCLSAVLVTKPVLGPNFSHLVTPVKSFYLGAISVSDCSQQYMQYVKKIIQLCSSVAAYRDIPWFINTMGFTKSLGTALLKQIVTEIQPTDVIQINSKKREDNFSSNLTKEFISNNDRVVQQSLNYKLHVIPSVSTNAYGTFDPSTSGISPAKKRELVVLSYFYEMLNPEKPIFTDCSPYKFPLNDIRLMITANDEAVELNMIAKMIALNATLIGLCYEEEPKLVEFKGFGIVRGVSFKDEEICIVTPVSEAELVQVNVIFMASTIQLPSSVYNVRNGNVKGNIPYMAQIGSSHLNKIIRKSSSRIRMYDKHSTG